MGQFGKESTWEAPLRGGAGIGISRLGLEGPLGGFRTSKNLGFCISPRQEVGQDGSSQGDRSMPFSLQKSPCPRPGTEGTGGLRRISPRPPRTVHLPQRPAISVTRSRHWRNGTKLDDAGSSVLSRLPCVCHRVKLLEWY